MLDEDKIRKFEVFRNNWLRGGAHRSRGFVLYQGTAGEGRSDKDFVKKTASGASGTE